MINTSLLVLKECIRAIDDNRRGFANTHIPFRQSKLTLALRDSFIDARDGSPSKMIMIGCVSPGSTFTDYSLNTLWYASKLGGTKKLNASKYMNGAVGSGGLLTSGSQSLNSSQLFKNQFNNQASALNGSFDMQDRTSLAYGLNDGPINSRAAQNRAAAELAETSSTGGASASIRVTTANILSKMSPGKVIDMAQTSTPKLLTTKSQRLSNQAGPRNSIKGVIDISGTGGSLRKISEPNHHMRDMLAPSESSGMLKKNNFLRKTESNLKTREEGTPSQDRTRPLGFTPEGKPKDSAQAGGIYGNTPPTQGTKAQRELVVKIAETLKQESSILKSESRLIAEAAESWDTMVTENREILLNNIATKIELLQSLQKALLQPKESQEPQD